MERTAGPETAGPETAAPADDEAAPGPPSSAGRPPVAWWRTLAVYGLAGAAFLALSVVLWWRVWTGHPSASATCGCGDPALFLWFLEWPAYALTHGHSPLYSSAVFPPTGMNLLSNTSVLAIGIPLVPVTLLFGPVATLNVALTATPVLTGLATFWLLRRWVRWTPAAFAGALVYAFSPYVLTNLSFAHLMLAGLAPLPLIVGCLDELLVRHRRSPVVVGAALAVLVAVEFFVSTETLVMLAFAVAVGLVLLVAGGVVNDRAAALAHLRRAGPGLAVAGGLVVVLLGYPVWFALSGPAHLTGNIWPSLRLPVIGGDEPRTLVVAIPDRTSGGFLALSGYFGPQLPNTSYVGWGLLVVPAAALALWWRDLRLWLLAGVAVATGSLSLGVRNGSWEPWRLFDRLPVVDNIIQQRFIGLTLLALCAMWAIGLDRASRLRFPGPGARRTGRRRSRGALGLVVPVVAVGAAGAAVVVPLAGPVAAAMPYAVRSLDVPSWFAGPGRHLPPGRVVLAYPAPFSGIESAMAWQAADEMRFAQAGGSGPQGVPQRAGRERPGLEVLVELGYGISNLPSATSSHVAAVRQALRGWGVTTVVVPEQHGLAPPDAGRDPWYAAAFMTMVLGTSPQVQSGAWVWPSIDLGRPAAMPSPGTLGRCSAVAQRGGHPGAVGSCVLESSHG